MNGTVLWDSSAILAILDADEPAHKPALQVADSLARAHRPGFITNYIEVEVHALLLRRLGRTAALRWLLQRTLPLERVQESEEEQARAILARYADKDWSLCDAMSFALMEARCVPAAFSYDQHFRQWGKVRILG